MQFFGHIAELAGCNSYTAELKASSQVADVMQIVEGEFPSVRRTNSYKIAVNTKYAGKNAPIKEGDTISFIPPVGGG